MQLHTMEAVGYCITQSWLSIITGHSDCGKTELIRTLAHATGNELLEISINNATDTMDILGSFEQVDSRVLIVETIRQTLMLMEQYSRTASGSKSCQNEALAFLHSACRTSVSPESVPQLLHAAANVLMSSTGWDAELSVQRENLLDKILDRVKETIAAPPQTGRFEWVDGPLVRAIKQGHWALLDGANLCNPSVLDRLNSLCEPNGCLVLSERGYVDGKIQSLVPHPNFRLFMTVDPRYGELSRAMRNRGIEMAMIVDHTTEDCVQLREHARLPTALAHITDSRALMLQFDGFRRGLFISPIPPSLQALSWPSGLSMSEDFGMSDVIEQTAPIFTSTCALPMDSVETVFARIPSPKYLSLVDRLCVNSATHVPRDSVHRLRALLRVVLPPFFSLTESVRETICSTRSLPASFVSTQVSESPNNFSRCPHSVIARRCFPALFSMS
jgi:midasin